MSASSWRMPFRLVALNRKSMYLHCRVHLVRKITVRGILDSTPLEATTAVSACNTGRSRYWCFGGTA